MEKSTILAIVLLVCLPFFSETSNYQPLGNNIQFTIVIDPGHGGMDSGALGSRVKEKDIALKLALKLGHYVNTYLPGVRVLYTRSTDKFVPLHERIEFANNNNADVFFSIHCNAMMTTPSAINGTETYVMGLHKATENLNVAKRENKAILMETNYSNNYGGYDPNSSEGHIMLSMYQNAYLSQSLLLAEKVESQFKNGAKRKSRGVKQAGFLVLRAATMPSILVETGFLSNSTEEAYLNSEKGQVYMASAMYRALKAYKSEVEGKTNLSYQAVSNKNYLAPKNKTTPSNTPNNNKIKDKRVVMQPTSSSSSNKGTSTTTRQPEMTVVEVPSIESMYPSTSSTLKTVTPSHSKTSLVEFKIQLASSPTLIDLKTGVWPSIKGVECLRVGNSYKCLIGNFNNLKAASQSQSYWRKNGFKDAFVVAFQNGQKISVADATNL